MTKLSGNTGNKMGLLIGTLVVAALVGLALYAAANKGPREVRTGANATFDTTKLPFTGKAEAPVSVLVVEDFKCPVCKGFEEQVMSTLASKYVDTGKAKVYSLVWPFLAEAQRLPVDDSKLAAQAAKCAYNQRGNEGFSAYKTILFRAQGNETQVWATKDRLKELAQSVEGLDQTAFGTCLDSDATAAAVDADEAQATANKVNHTPTVYVNGKEIIQMGGLEKFGEDIGKAIEDAAGKPAAQ